MKPRIAVEIRYPRVTLQPRARTGRLPIGHYTILEMSGLLSAPRDATVTEKESEAAWLACIQSRLKTFIEYHTGEPAEPATICAVQMNTHRLMNITTA